MPAQTGKKTISKRPKKKLGEARTKYKARQTGAPTSRRNIIIKKCRETLARYYSSRLKSVILYGSTARGQAGPSSDIDLLVLLASPVDYFAELRQLVDLLYPIQLESKQLISAKPVFISDFESGKISLYRNAKRDGIIVK